MKALVFCLLMFLSLNAIAVGGVWLLEINFIYNGKAGKSYINSDINVNHLKRYINKADSFQIVFNTLFKNSSELVGYDRITDHERLKKISNLPIHPFEIDYSSRRVFDRNFFEAVSLIKVWSTIAYSIECLTPIDSRDTTWLTNLSSTSDLGDGDVGCRLQLYHYSDRSFPEPLAKQLADLYFDLNFKPENKDFQDMIRELKLHKVVVMQFCGC